MKFRNPVSAAIPALHRSAESCTGVFPGLVLLLLMLACGNHWAQQSQDFGHYRVHYNVINSDLIPAQVAQGYGIKRSSSRALVNITVMDLAAGEPGEAIAAGVATEAVNLTGQRRVVEMREISEPDGGLYYIGELPIHNLDNYNFLVTVTVAGEAKPFELEFRQEFYTE
jgi:hypothetical protein